MIFGKSRLPFAKKVGHIHCRSHDWYEMSHDWYEMSHDWCEMSHDYCDFT